MKTGLFIVLLPVLTVCKGIAQRVALQELVDKRRYAEVMAYAATLQPADTADYATMYAIGQACEGMLKYRDAYRYYRRCLTIDSTRTDLLATASRMAANLGKTAEAETYLQQLRARDTTDFYANYQLARLYAQQGEYPKAIGRYEFLLRQDPENSVLMRLIGDCYNRMDYTVSAFRYYLNAFRREPENVSLAASLSNLLLLLQEPEEAVSVCDTSLRYHPQSRLLLQSKGLALFTMQKYAQADTVYSMLMAQADSSYNTLKYGGSDQYYAGQYMRAIEPLENAYQKDTTSVEVCLLLGSSLGRTFDRKRAFKLFDKAEALMQPSPALVDMLIRFRAETLDRDNQHDKANVLYYQLWTESQRFDMLGCIWQRYRTSKMAEQSDDYRRRALFINMLFATEYLKRPERRKDHLVYLRSLLSQFQEEMFFRSVKQLPTLAPDGKKGVCTEEQLQTVIRQLPEKE